MARVLTFSLFALLLAAVVQGEDTITGTWQGTTTNAGSQIVLELTAADNALTGTLTRNGETVKI